MPDLKTTHPTVQQLTDYGLGKLPKAQLSAIHQHLVACPVCRAKVEKQAPDSFIGQLRAAGRGGAQSPTTPPSASNTALPARKAAPSATCGDVPAELAASSKFEILGKLGQGGMGSVYKARHTFLDELVAIKVMNADVVADPEARSRFLREMQAAGKLKHPNIVRALDAEQVGDVLVLVMELVPGITLEHLVKQRGALPVDFACNCIMQAAEGLQHAHEKGMVHRDIKPANLIVTPKDQAIKVLDFGLARGPREQNAKAKQTALETFMGTPEYVAPEQAVDARSADIRADVYSLGCTLYCLLADRPPFQADTPTNTIIAQIQDEAPPLTELRPEVPVALGAVVATMLAKKPAERYQTPIDVARALQPFVSGGAKARRAEARPGTGLKGDPGPPPPPPSRVRPAPEPQEAEESPFAVSSGMRAPAPPARPRRENAKAKGKRSAWVVWAAGAACLVSMSLVALVVLTLNTAKGKVVVEIDQPDAQVFIDGKKISIQVAGEMQPIEIEVDEGNHELKVKKDGFETVTREFSYSKGKKPVVRVRMENRKLMAATEGLKPPVHPPESPVKSVAKEKTSVGEERPAKANPAPSEPKSFTSRVFSGHKSRVRQVLFTPDGLRLISATNANYVDLNRIKCCGPDNTVRVWNLESGNQIRCFDFSQFRFFGAQGLSVSPNGRFVAICTSWDWPHPWMAPLIYAWEIDTGVKKHQINLPNQVFLPAIAFSQDGETLRVAHSGNQIVSWSFADSRERVTKEVDKETFPLAFAPEGGLLIGGDNSGKVWVWNASTGRKTAILAGHLKPPLAAASSRDGTRLLTSAADFSVRLWEIASGKELTCVKGLDTVARSVALSPDGTRFVTGEDDGLVRLWDAATGKELARLTGHKGKVHSVALSRDGKQVASGGEDTTVRVWRLPAP